MLPFPLNQLDYPTLQQLCDEEASESLTLEFKRELPGKEKSQKAEFLKDVTALANAEGGDLLYGIEEKSGTALRLKPIENPIDSEKRRLGQILDGGIEPRITGIQMVDVPVPGGYILALRIPQSFDGPHQVVFEAEDKFYLRTGTHTTRMSYTQLKSAFDRTAMLAERVKMFRQERLEAILKEKTPKRVMKGPLCVIHIIPLSSQTGRHSIDVVELSRNSIDISISQWGLNTNALNLDGVVAYQVTNEDSLGSYGYNQIYRIGCTESVCFGGALRASEKLVPSTTITSHIRTAIVRNVELLKKNGMTGPAVIGVAMLNVSGYTLGVGNNLHFHNPVSDRTDLVLPETWVESLETLTDVDQVVAPMMDVLWQCFGIERCFEYQGKLWKPRL